MSDKSIVCVWNMGTDCEGDVSKQFLFSGQIEIPICNRHFYEHQKFLFSQKHGTDITEYLNKSAEERDTIFNKLRAKFPDEDLTS